MVVVLIIIFDIWYINNFNYLEYCLNVGQINNYRIYPSFNQIYNFYLNNNNNHIVWFLPTDTVYASMSNVYFNLREPFLTNYIKYNIKHYGFITHVLYFYTTDKYFYDYQSTCSLYLYNTVYLD